MEIPLHRVNYLKSFFSCALAPCISERQLPPVSSHLGLKVLAAIFLSPLGSIPTLLCFYHGSDDKEPACNVGDSGLMPGLGRSSGEGHGNPLQYSCLENYMDRGAW